MKCVNHPDVDAVAACVNCGRLICSSCRIVIEDKNYCQSCVNEMFQKKFAEKPRTGKPIAGGILGIIAGVIGIGWSLYYGFPVLGVIVAIVAIVGSAFAIARKNFAMAVIGSVFAIVSGGLFGIIALILIIMSRNEFADSK